MYHFLITLNQGDWSVNATTSYMAGVMATK